MASPSLDQSNGAKAAGALQAGGERILLDLRLAASEESRQLAAVWEQDRFGSGDHKLTAFGQDTKQLGVEDERGAGIAQRRDQPPIGFAGGEAGPGDHGVDVLRQLADHSDG